MKRVTLEQIAAKLNISKVSVFKALNDRAGISPTLRKQIKDTAVEMGYFMSDKSDKLSFIFAIDEKFFLTPAEQFYNPIYYFLCQESDRNNSTIRMVFLNDRENTVVKLKSAVLSQENISGIFIAGEQSDENLKALTEFNVPIVFLDYYNPQYPFSCVYLDNYYLAFQLTNLLINANHKKIGFVGDINSTNAISDRYYGYLKALSKNKLDINSTHHININIEQLANFENILPIDLPTAFVCHCDAAAQKLYSLLSIHNLHVPQDVSVISFDNTSLCENISPRLTSAGINKKQMAKKSYQIMLDILNNPNKQYQFAVKPLFNERESVQKL